MVGTMCGCVREEGVWSEYCPQDIFNLENVVPAHYIATTPDQFSMSQRSDKNDNA